MRESLLRFGICGLGFMGRQYFAHLRSHPQARVVAVCDRNADRRGGRWTDRIGDLGLGRAGQVDLGGLAVYAEADELIADADVDVVALALPTPLHAELTVRALEAGKHVLCEKPMATTLAECDRMIAAAERSGRTLMIAHCIRFWPQYELIKQLVDAGRVGAVRFVALRRLSSLPRHTDGDWMLDGCQSGGALLDLQLHDVDFAQHLLGLPTEVYARGWREPGGRIDHVVATLGYADGRYVMIEGAWTCAEPWPFEMAITVHGERGTLDWALSRGPEVLLYAGGSEPERLSVPDQTGWARELDYFISCVAAGRPVTRCLPAASRTSIALTLLERESIERGAVLKVPQSL